MKKLLIILLLGLIYSCEDTDQIPLASGSSLLVVEGWFSDQLSRQYVKLSSSVKFTSSSEPIAIEDAEVSVFEGAKEIRYAHLDNGYYLSVDSVRGVKGKSYYLEVKLPTGEVIRSEQEIMLEAPSIDSLGFDFYTEDIPDSPEDEIIYFPVAFSDDPAGEVNYYRWKIYKNDTLFSKAEEMFLFSDRFIDGNDQIPQEFVAYTYAFGDTARLELQEISRDAFRFLHELKSQTTTLGTNSAVSPAAIKGNLYILNENRQVLGYFGVISVTSEEKIVQ